jgi:hypothetical protein
MPEMTGGVLSILIVTGTKLDRPSPFVAEQVSVVPGVSLVRDVTVQPDEDTIPDSGSLTLQLTLTLLMYQPLVPKVPLIAGTITGGVVSTCWKSAKGEREVTLPHTMLSAVSCEVVTSIHAFPSK